MTSFPRIGFMQGRLCARVDGKIQAFPWRDWPSEFEAAQELGLGLMEWTLDQDRLFENPLMTEAGQARIRDLSTRHGVRVLSVTGDNFMHAPFWKAEGVERQALIETFEALIDACSRAGITYIVVPFVDGGRIETPEQEDVVIAGLLGLEDRLRAADVKVVFESDYPPLELKRFVARLPKELFGVNYDIGNSASLGYDCSSEIAAYGDRILNVHVKDRMLGGTTVPLGEGNADLPRAVTALVKAGYPGHFILQTARAEDDSHAEVLARYRDLTAGWIAEAGSWTSN